jgi:hypothetical protein
MRSPIPARRPRGRRRSSDVESESSPSREEQGTRGIHPARTIPRPGRKDPTGPGGFPRMVIVQLPKSGRSRWSRNISIIHIDR